jgi:hypothetical protein
MDPLGILLQTGVLLQRQVIAPESIRSYQEVVRKFYDNLEARIASGGVEAVQKSLSPGQKYLPTASSITLGTVFAEEEWSGILKEIAIDPLRGIIEVNLGGSAACDVDQSWIRRQYAPCNSPPTHSPHVWHQDGALGFDFHHSMATASRKEHLLSMVTCWIPLNPCGVDAPGLEFVNRRIDDLLQIEDLKDQALRKRFPENAFEKPVMKAGDVLLFRGGIVHRTHVNSEMRSNRTSIELRFFLAAEIPSRLAQDRFVRLE